MDRMAEEGLLASPADGQSKPPERPNRQVAEVLIEVRARGLNQTFDYLISEPLRDMVRIGSRVIVPLGPRKVQGYVLHVKEVGMHPDNTGQKEEQREGRDQQEKEREQRKKAEGEYRLKSILAVLDEHPPLTEELIELGRWMSERYVCLLISALQAMLPSVLKGKTYKTVQFASDGKTKVTYHVQDRVTVKKVSMVEKASAEANLEQTLASLSPRAHKQADVIRYVFNRSEPAPLPDVLEACQTTRSVVKSLADKHILRLYQEERKRDPYAGRKFAKSEPLVLTAEQADAYRAVTEKAGQREHATFLLHGVTGSGKTEVYLQTIDYVLKQGREAIVLVPEISLTPQMVERFKGRFGEQVAVLHSRLSAGERYDEWRKIHEHRVKVAIGARSALFAPFNHLGLIIIDEEHEGSYKQEETPRYHARDIALFRGQHHGAPVVLGSATPALESYARAQKNVYRLLELPSRVQQRKLPPVEIVDMRRELQSGNLSMFSRNLHGAIRERLERGEQIVLFLNRRGFSTFVMCRDCGYVLGCPHCDISLTYHKSDRTHRCHYCGYSEPQVAKCPECNSEHIRFFGTGTQKVEEELYKHFPGIRVLRMDVDTTRRKGSHEKLLRAFGNGEADCLLGTQMIAKGLDFENVTLVGVLAADALLHLPDFRSAERTFQLLTQVSGRAGRHQLPGEVVVQTYNPYHYSIRWAADHDYRAFYKEEMRYRHKQGYPPYFFITLLTFSHEDLTRVVKVAEQSAEWLKQQLSDRSIVLGPVASPVPKIKDRYRYHCMIKYRDEPLLGKILQQLLERLHDAQHLQHILVQVDMQPQMFM